MASSGLKNSSRSILESSTLNRDLRAIGASTEGVFGAIVRHDDEAPLFDEAPRSIL